MIYEFEKDPVNGLILVYINNIIFASIFSFA